ncbi:MAG: hypothetical protein ACI9P5_004734 [Saprospiraceae bacterium]|jgi:hypothetical protein
MKRENENIESICTAFLGQEILWIVTPPFEYDIKNNVYWLEEDQGTRAESKTIKAQMLIHLKQSGQKYIFGLTDNWHEENGICYPLFSLNFQIDGELEVMKSKKEYSPVNVLAGIDFQISEIELWNRMDNFNNVYIKDDVIRIDTIIFYSNDNRQMVIQALESVSQENCIKLRIRNTLNKEIELEKKYQMELISQIGNPAGNN